MIGPCLHPKRQYLLFLFRLGAFLWFSPPFNLPEGQNSGGKKVGLVHSFVGFRLSWILLYISLIKSSDFELNFVNMNPIHLCSGF